MPCQTACLVFLTVKSDYRNDFYAELATQKRQGLTSSFALLSPNPWVILSLARNVINCALMESMNGIDIISIATTTIAPSKR
jgi:hypothetical protein